MATPKLDIRSNPHSPHIGPVRWNPPIMSQFVPSEKTKWKRKLGLWDSRSTHPDMTVASWILNTVAKEVTRIVIYSSSAATTWRHLEVRFRRHNGPRIFQLKKDLLNCPQGSLSISHYFTKVKYPWEELGEYSPAHTCNYRGVAPILNHLQLENVLNFLMGLNDSFSNVRYQLLLMKPIPSVDEVFSLILQE